MADQATTITADNFPVERAGIRLAQNESGYTAYGHHDGEKVAAAIVEDARESGYTLDDITPEDLAASADRMYVNNVTLYASGEWSAERCEPTDDGAVAVTSVDL